MSPRDHARTAEDFLEQANDVYCHAIERSRVDDLIRFKVQTLTAMAEVHAHLAALAIATSKETR